MTLKNILESVNLATERKKKFEAEKLEVHTGITMMY